MTILYFTLLFILIFLCPILCLIVLIQEAKSLGLGASFGGDSGDSLFGTSTPEILKKATAWMGCAFMILCILLSFWTSSLSRQKLRMAEKEIIAQESVLK